MRLKHVFTLLTVAVFAGTMLFGEECPFHNKKGAPPADGKTAIVHCSNLPKPGKTIKLTDGNEFAWQFADKVKLGPNVLKVTIKDLNKLDTKNYVIKATLDMPSMKGAHSSGSKELVLNKKGDFVAPMDFVMRGDWEVCIEIFYKDQPLLNGKYTLSL